MVYFDMYDFKPFKGHEIEIILNQKYCTSDHAMEHRKYLLRATRKR
jgi:hypothetical protein